MNDALKTKGHMAHQGGIRGHSASSLFASTGVVMFHRLVGGEPKRFAMFPNGAEIEVLSTEVVLEGFIDAEIHDEEEALLA